MPDTTSIHLQRPLVLIGASSGLCLTDAGDGAQLTLQGWTGDDAQLWRLESAGSGHGMVDCYLRNIGSGRVADISQHSRERGAAALSYASTGGDNQKWRLQQDHEPGYRLQSVESKLVLDVKGGATEPGAKLIQWTWNGGGNQRWIIGELMRYGQPFALRSHHGFQLTADPDGALTNEVTHIKEWEQLTFVRPDGGEAGPLQYGDVVAVRTHHGTYLSAEPDGSLHARATSVRGWEQFTITREDGGARPGPVSTGAPICLRGAHGKWVMGHSDHTVNAAAQEPRSWERWLPVVAVDGLVVTPDRFRRATGSEPMSLYILAVRCIRPATGIEGDVAQFFSDVGAFIAETSLEISGQAGLWLAVSGLAMYGGAELAKWIDADRDPDDLYLRRDGHKIWPAGEYASTRANDGHDINVQVPFTGSCRVELMEYDSGSG
ncbi:MAG: RICIN domain-containing protein, partial [Myxococcales bacterium]|nr:RICIN domain-containing protein [Myxococcales bacterium]